MTDPKPPYRHPVCLSVEAHGPGCQCEIDAHPALPLSAQISEWTIRKCLRFIAADRLSRLPWPVRWSEQAGRLVRAVAGFSETDSHAPKEKPR